RVPRRHRRRLFPYTTLFRSALDAGESAEPPKEFQLPTSDLLEEAEEFPYEALASKAQGAAATLEKTFKEFGLNVKVVEIDTGPVDRKSTRLNSSHVKISYAV